MTNSFDVVKAMENAEYRDTLSEEQLMELDMPVLSEVDAALIEGGTGSGGVATVSGDCNGTGRSCHTLRGLWDEACSRVFEH